MNFFSPLNKLDSNLIKHSFVEIFFNLKFLNSKFFLFKNINCINVEYLNTMLTFDEKNFEPSSDWIFHYFIPSNHSNKNYLIVGSKNYFNIDVLNTLKPEYIYNDKLEIINIICNDIDWSKENLNNHTFKWKDQQVVSYYLDLICGGFSVMLPFHWDKPDYIKELDPSWFDNTLWYYNIYLKENNLIDNLENKIYFINNYNLIL